MSKSPKKKNESNQIEEILGFGNYSTRKSYYPELQKSIEELKESETKYKSFLATSPDAIVVTDLAGIVTFSNPKFEQIHGLEREGEWIGKSALELIAEEDKQRILESIQHIISNGLVENLEFNLLKKDGSVFPAEISGNVIKDKDGNPQSLLIISRDISDRKQVEDALKSLSSSYVNLKGKDFFEAISEHIAVSMNLDYVYVGKLLADDMIEVAGGFALGEKMGDLSYDLENTPCRNVIDQEFRLHPSGIQKSFPKDQLLIDLNIDGYIGSPLINYNGESIGIIVGLSIKPINNIEIVQQYFKIFIDRIVAEIAKSKAEEALLLSEDRLSKIMIAANDGLWDWYIKSGYTYFDPRYYTMAGYEVDEFPHRLEEFQKRVHPDDIDFVMDQADQHMRGEIDRFKIEFRFKKKDGSWLWVLARGIIVEYDSENKPARFVGTHTNITDRKKAEEALTASQLRFEALFNDSPVPLWEEDFTEVYKFLNSLKQNGVEDFGAHFNKNPEDVFRCSHLIKIENVNSAALSLHEANSKEELLGNLDKIFTDRSYTVFIDELVALAQGKLEYSSEGEVKTLTGKEKYVYLKFKVEQREDGKYKAILATTDISDRKLSEKALVESENKYRSLIENSNDAIYLLYNRKFEMVNNKFSEIFSYTLEDVSYPEFDFMKLVSPKSMEFIEDRIRRATSGEKIDPKYEFIAVDKNGNEINCEVNTTYIKYKDGFATQGIIRDITERKRSEEDLRKLSRAVEQSPVSIIITDIQGRIEYVNPKFTSISGYTLDDVKGENPSILKSGSMPDEKYKELWETISRGGTWRGEFHNKRKNGEYYWELASISSIKDSSGLISHFIAIKEDITERKKIEELLIDSEKFIKGISDASPAIIYLYDIAKNENIYINKTVERNLGYSVNEIKNMGASFFSTMAHPDDLHNIIEHFAIIEEYCKNLIKPGKSFDEIDLSQAPVFTMQFRLKHKNGKYLWLQSWDIIHKISREGKLEQLLGTSLDISEKKAIESELVAAKEKAEKSDKIKTEFLAQMSHEIRTPLNVMMNYTSLLKEEIDDDQSSEINEIFQSISNAGSRIIRTIDLILNSSELQAGAYYPINKKVDVFQDIIMGVYNDLKHSADSKNIEMSVKRSAANSFVLCDEYSVYQSVVNLVDNAIKYTDEGFIEIRLSRDENKNLKIEIEDSGIGISEEYMNNLFEAFSQEETGYSRRFEGTGLGLSLVKNYCDINNIKINVNSEKDSGTIFSLTFNES